MVRAYLRGVQGVSAFVANFSEKKPKLPSSHDLLKAKIMSNFLDDNSSILDVGCGNGRRLMDLSLFLKNLDCTGIEINKNSSLPSYPEDIKNNIKLKSFDGLNIPFENNSFDYISICYVLHHLSTDHAQKIINEMIRVGKNRIIILEDSRPKFSTFYKLRNWLHATEANLEYATKSEFFVKNFQHNMFKNYNEWESFLMSFPEIKNVQIKSLSSISKYKHHTLIVCDLKKEEK